MRFWLPNKGEVRLRELAARRRGRPTARIADVVRPGVDYGLRMTMNPCIELASLDHGPDGPPDPLARGRAS